MPDFALIGVNRKEEGTPALNGSFGEVQI